MATLETLLLLSVLTKGYWCTEVAGDVVQSQLEQESSICQIPLLKESQRSWKDGNQNIDVFLTRDNFACQVGDPCTSPSPQDGIVVSILQVDLQRGDWLTLWFNEEGDANLTDLYLTINPMSLQEMYSCDANQQPEAPPFIARNAENKDNVTLGTELLATGVHLFSVRLSTPSAVCGLSWRINVTVKPQDCTKYPSSPPCFGYGSCITEPEKATFTCHCCPGYVGKYCEERDGCHGNPCQHDGFCVDITEGLAGNTYQCLCPHGYKGKSCEIQLNICDKKPCQNNASCWGNETTYYCNCRSGFTGQDCETNINECQPNPCVHGVCEDEVAKYKCYCLPGYGGDHCEFEYDECDSSPCINGGACEDLVAGYRCHCGPGYKGRRCQVKVDLCYPNPCTAPAQCVDRGNNYSCICHPGYNGPGCTQRYDSCYPNPCQNGGTCQSNIDWFSCTCAAGYTGDICNERSPHPLPRTLQDTSEHNPGSSFIDSANEALDHLHNIYIAVAALAGACLIVLAMAIACHCRAHKTYQRFTRKRSRSCSDIKKQKFEDPDKLLLNFNGGASEKSHYQDPRYEATSIDLVDNVSTPLID